jgi:hypothetical protein
MKRSEKKTSRRAIRGLAAALFAIAVQSCSREQGGLGPEAAAPAAPAEAGPPPPAEPPAPPSGPVTSFSGGAASPEELGRKALAAIALKDAAALAALRVTEAEYRDILFPKFPEAQRPENTLKVEFHWFLLDSKSKAGIRDAINNYGGKTLTLEGIVVTDGVVDHGTYKIHRKVLLRCRMPNGGTEDLRIFGSIVEMDGQFKVLSYPS